MKKKHILRIALSSILLVIVLFTVLVAHIWQRVGPTNKGHLNWQLARLDFQADIREADVALLKQVVGEVSGVTRVHVDTNQNTLVYSFDPGTVSQQAVADKVNQETTIKAQPFILDKAAIGTGCPAIDRDGFSGKLVSIIRRIKY